MVNPNKSKTSKVNKPKKAKKIAKPPKQEKQKKQKKQEIIESIKRQKRKQKKQQHIEPSKDQQKKPRGKRQCPECNRLVGIRKYQCQHCGYNFPQKQKIVNKDTVFKKSNEKSILTVLQHNIFNTLPKITTKSTFAEFKPVVRPIIAQQSSKQQQMSMKINNQIHKIKYYKPSLINKKFRIFAGKHNMKCVRITDYALVFSQQLNVEAFDLTNQDESTVRMFGLQFFHKLGHRYEGESNLYISLSHLEKGYYRASIKKNIVQIELKFNIAAILCGDGSVEIYVLPSKPESGEQQITLSESSKIATNNGITICWLNTSLMGLILGDTNGNIKIFTLDSFLQPTLTRLYPHAHHNHITSIKCCPLNDSQSLLFCSSGYDGCLKIWDYNEINHIYQIDITSKKINNVMWDNGGKFILIQRDDICDGCSLLTFFSTIKTVKKQVLMSECEQRYIKEYNNYQYLASSPTSNLCAFASSQGGMEICDLQHLRKVSVKKKSHSVISYPFSGFNISTEGNIVTLNEEKMKSGQDTFDPYEHIISDVSIVKRNNKEKIVVSTYPGLIIILEKQAEKEKK